MTGNSVYENDFMLGISAVNMFSLSFELLCCERCYQFNSTIILFSFVAWPKIFLPLPQLISLTNSVGTNLWSPRWTIWKLKSAITSCLRHRVESTLICTLPTSFLRLQRRSCSSLSTNAFMGEADVIISFCHS